MDDANFRLDIDNEFYISHLKIEDVGALVTHLNRKDAFEQMIVTMPNPYCESDALTFLRRIDEEAKSATGGVRSTWAIRASKDRLLIGTIGLHITQPNHEASIGYWLAQEFWGKGLMTKAVCAVVDNARSRFSLVRIFARVRDSNIASAKVLLKAGFEQEGLCRKLWKKGNEYIDCKIFAKILN